jgi:hypothetical protein
MIEVLCANCTRVRCTVDTLHPAIAAFQFKLLRQTCKASVNSHNMHQSPAACNAHHITPIISYHCHIILKSNSCYEKHCSSCNNPPTQTNQLPLHPPIPYSSIPTSHTAEKAAASSVAPALLLCAAVPLLLTALLPGHAPALATDVLPLHLAMQLLA